MRRRGLKKAEQTTTVLVSLLDSKGITASALSDLCQIDVSGYVEGTELPSDNDCVLMAYHLGTNPNAILEAAGHGDCTSRGYDVLTPWWSGASDDAEDATPSEIEEILRFFAGELLAMMAEAMDGSLGNESLWECANDLLTPPALQYDREAFQQQLTAALRESDLTIGKLSLLTGWNLTRLLDSGYPPPPPICVLTAYHLRINPNDLLAAIGEEPRRSYDELSSKWSKASKAEPVLSFILKEIRGIDDQKTLADVLETMSLVVDHYVRLGRIRAEERNQ